MINKKLGISIPWKTITNSLNLVCQEQSRNLIMNMFLKQNIFISEIYIQEFPKFLNINITLFPISSTQYNLIIKLNLIITKILYFVWKKNVYIAYKINKNLYTEINILTYWLFLKLYNQPTNIKRSLKQILKNYDTITK